MLLPRMFLAIGNWQLNCYQSVALSRSQGVGESVAALHGCEA